MVKEPFAYVMAHCPDCGTDPVVWKTAKELDFIYVSVMTLVLPPAPQVVVFTVLYASGGRDDWGDLCPAAIVVI